MQYIVSRSQPYAIPNDEDALDYLLGIIGCDSVEELAEDCDDPSYLTMTPPELAEQWHDATLEDGLDSYEYVDREGDTMSYDEIEDHVRDMISEEYGEVEIAGMVFDAGYVLAELDPTAFRCTVLDYMDGEFFESWDEWHNVVA